MEREVYQYIKGKKGRKKKVVIDVRECADSLNISIDELLHTIGSLHRKGKFKKIKLDLS